MNSAIFGKLVRINGCLRTLVVLGVLLLLSQSLMATGETKRPTIEAELSVEVPDTLELNEPFEVTFFFETLEELHVDPKRPHKASIRPPREVVYVNGDTLWTGFLQVGQRLSITATYMIADTVVYDIRFRGWLETRGGTEPAIHTVDPAFGFESHLNGASSDIPKEFPGKPKNEPSIKMYIVTKSGELVLDTTQSQLIPPPSIMKKSHTRQR